MYKQIILGIIITLSLTACFDKVDVEGVEVARLQTLPIIEGKNIKWLEQQFSKTKWEYSEADNTLILFGKVKSVVPNNKQQVDVFVTFNNADELLDKKTVIHGYMLTTLLSFDDAEYRTSINVLGEQFSEATIAFNDEATENRGEATGLLSNFYTGETAKNVIGQKLIQDLWLQNISIRKQFTFLEKSYGELCDHSQVNCVIQYIPFDDEIGMEITPQNTNDVKRISLKIKDAGFILSADKMKLLKATEIISLKDRNVDGDILSPMIITESTAIFDGSHETTSGVVDLGKKGAQVATIDSVREYIYPMFKDIYSK